MKGLMRLFKNSAIVKAAASMTILIIIVATISLQLLSHTTHAHANGPVTFTKFPLPIGALSIANGPDGNIWFTDYNADKIGRFTLSGGVTEFPMPSTDIPFNIISGPDGNLWFTEDAGNKIGRITPSGMITEFPLPTTTSTTWGIASGPDGNIWFTENKDGTDPSQFGKIGRITPTGAITEFPVPSTYSPGLSSRLFGITTGPDGNLWFTEWDNGMVGRITPNGVLSEFGVPTGYPDDIVAGSDGNLWFTEALGDKIGRITPSGTSIDFALPATGSYPDAITNGPDGNLWFTELEGGRVGQITASGAITEFPQFTFNSNSHNITSGSDGNLWFITIDSPDGSNSFSLVRANLSGTPPPQSQAYVALGDSYSSGEGNPPFNANKDCDRSYNAWPYLLAKSDTSIKLSANVACSGAKASNALTKSYNPCSSTPCPQLPQISVIKALQPALVTITIGGNDLGFASTLRGCYLEGIAHRQNLCVDRLYSQVAVINSFEKKAVGYYEEIKAALPSTSKVYVVGYPNLFPTHQKDTIHCGWLSNAGRVEFNNLAILLDKVLHDAANAAGVNYISTLYALKGHELCTSHSWVNPIASRHGPADVTSDGHPTLPGQQAIGTIVDTYIHQ